MRTAVIVPAYERPGSLAACLLSLARLDPAPDEIVVVDDGSRTPLAPLCPDIPRLRVLRRDNGGPAAARNAGVEASDAHFLAFTDDDCRPRPGWLGALVEAHEGDPWKLVGGAVRDAARSVFSAASHTMGEHLNASSDAAGGGAEFFASNNLGCGREGFEEVGGFDEAFPLAAGEDRDFGRRWRAAGGTLALAPEAVVDHDHPMRLPGFWRQHSNYGRGAYLVHRRSERRDDGPRSDDGALQGAGFYAGLVTRPLRDGAPRPVVRTGLLLLSQIATCQGYVRQALASRRGR